MLRYFVAHRASAVALPPAAEATLVRALDAFVVAGPRRVVVARDMAGDLFLADDADLPDTVRAAVTQHELARPKPARFVDVDEVWLFTAELLEQAADTPGANDPVQLYGRLCGPFARGAPATAHNGQLTLTRGDLLRGFVDSAAHGFVVDDGAVLHACVPGERAEELAQGRGLVLVYPLLPPDADAGGANEPVAQLLLHGLLHALHDDLARHKSTHAFARGPLVDGTMKDALVAARDALGALAGFPDARSSALWSRVTERAPALAPAHARPSTPVARAAPVPVQQPWRRAAPDWMRDFETSSPPPRRTRVVDARAPRPPTKGPPDWMKDFE